jgi:hypothetical protein
MSSRTHGRSQEKISSKPTQALAYISPGAIGKVAGRSGSCTSIWKSRLPASPLSKVEPPPFLGRVAVSRHLAVAYGHATEFRYEWKITDTWNRA